VRYSALKVFKEALTGHKGWRPVWRKADPKSSYDIIIIGGGGHGLATAHYLASKFNKKNIAVLEKAWIGGGNVGRNTTIIRSNYLLNGNEAFYEMSLKLWEGLEQDVNYNAMVSQRGIINLYHSDGQRDAYVRRGNAMHLHGADAVLLDQDGVRKQYPFLNFDNARFPIQGGLWQPRGGTVRHDAVAWGYAHAADKCGVDIIENCEVTGFDIQGGKCIGVETTRGKIGAKKIGVITYGAGHFYVSQSDKGGLVFGGDIDGYNSYAQRGNLPVVEDVCEGGMSIMPMIGKARLLRMWGGIMDMSMDGSPIIDKTDIDGLYFNGGWCYGGFKATPASGYSFAHLLATDMPHETAKAYRMDRFSRGYMIDEKGQGAQPNLH